FSLRFGEAFDRISQASTRHPRVILREKIQHCGLGPLTGFAQHPTDGFVDQVVLVFQQEGGDAKCIFEVASFDECRSRNNRDSTLPNIRRLGEAIEDLSRPGRQMLSHDTSSAGIAEISVIYVARVLQVEIKHLLFCAFVPSLKLKYKDLQGGEAVLMHAR